MNTKKLLFFCNSTVNDAVKCDNAFFTPMSQVHLWKAHLYHKTVELEKNSG